MVDLHAEDIRKMIDRKEYNKKYYQEHKEEEKTRAKRNRDKINGYRNQDKKNVWANNKYKTDEVFRNKQKVRNGSRKYKPIPRGYDIHHFEPYHEDNIAIIPRWMHKIEHGQGWEKRLC